MMTENCSYHPSVPEDAVNIAHFISNSFRYANATVYLHWALLWGYADADELKKGVTVVSLSSGLGVVPAGRRKKAMW